ncbi:hypothetical protein CRU99_13630, partial [Malaciobacter mytili]|uniref:acyltransferase family protein n=1 Tax=Malaciobacter mytili TaxID=603050 RepID=UPI001026A174
MHIISLDYFRGILAFFILLCHINQIFFYPLYFNQSNFFLIFDNIAAYSVLGFLLISGYSISNSLYNNYSKFGYINIQYYVKKRILRIYPPLIGALILMLIIYSLIKYFNLHGFESYRLEEDLYIVREKFDLNFTNLFQMLVFLPRALYSIAVPSSNGPLWSLSLEVWYYFLILLVFLQIYSKSLIVKVISFSILILIFYFQVTNEGYINRQFLYLFLVFFIGAACSYFINCKKNISRKKLNFILLLLFFSSLYFLFKYGLNILKPYNDDLHYIFMIINSTIMMFIYI